MRARGALVLFLLLAATVAPALACDCMAAPEASVAGTYRWVTLFLCVLPLSIAWGLFRWIRAHLPDGTASASEWPSVASLLPEAIASEVSPTTVP